MKIQRHRPSSQLLSSRSSSGDQWGRGVWSRAEVTMGGRGFGRAVVTRGEGGIGRAVVTRGQGGLVEQW